MVYRAAERPASEGAGKDNTGKGDAVFCRSAVWIQNRSGAQVFFGSLLLLCLAWLPIYLAYYPGICAYDAPVQTGQIVEHYYFDHHPIVHTLLLQGMLWLGTQLFGSMNAGMALYTALQMLLLAVACPTACWYCTDARWRQAGSSCAAAWNVFPVPLVYECQHDKRYGIQCFFIAATDQSDGAIAGGPQGMASWSPGSAVFYRNNRNDTVSQ